MNGYRNHKVTSKVTLKYDCVTADQLARLHAVLASDKVKGSLEGYATDAESGHGYSSSVRFVKLISSEYSESTGYNLEIEVTVHAPKYRYNEFASYKNKAELRDGSFMCPASVLRAIHDALGIFPRRKR